MKLTPSSTARRSAAWACSRSGGGPQMPCPVIRIAPKPRRFTVRSPPMSIVPAADASGCPAIAPPFLTSFSFPYPAPVLASRPPASEPLAAEQDPREAFRGFRAGPVALPLSGHRHAVPRRGQELRQPDIRTGGTARCSRRLFGSQHRGGWRAGGDRGGPEGQQVPGRDQRGAAGGKQEHGDDGDRDDAE